MSYNNCCHGQHHGWGSLLGGGIIGYFLGAATGGAWLGGPRGSVAPAMAVAATNASDCKLDAVLSNQASFQRQADTANITGAITAGTADTLAAINSVGRDNYTVSLSNLISLNNQFRNVDQQFCNTNAIVTSQADATRAAIQSFRDQYNQDRYNDVLQKLTAAENKLANVPLELAVSNLSNSVSNIQSNFIPGAVRCVPACPSTSNLCPCAAA